MKQYLDHMIANGDIEPMIVVTPTFNNAAGSDMTANAKNFWKELAKDVVPAVEGKYSTYTKTTSAGDLKASRMHRAFGGFSMGSLTTWYVMLNDLDYFAYIMPLSGDCWAGNTADEKAASVENAVKKSGYAKDQYFLMCATGKKDIAYSAMNDQINAIKRRAASPTHPIFPRGISGSCSVMRAPTGWRDILWIIFMICSRISSVKADLSPAVILTDPSMQGSCSGGSLFAKNNIHIIHRKSTS